IVVENGPTRDPGEVVARALRCVEAKVARRSPEIEYVSHGDTNFVPHDIRHQLRKPGANGEYETIGRDSLSRLQDDVLEAAGPSGTELRPSNRDLATEPFELLGYRKAGVSGSSDPGVGFEDT